jgi:hypothetical protein
MTSRRIFSWSKRQSGSEYYRTGGIVPIDTSPDLSNNGAEAKVRADGSRRRCALAKRTDVVAQSKANTTVLSKALRMVLCMQQDACSCVV